MRVVVTEKKGAEKTFVEWYKGRHWKSDYELPILAAGAILFFLVSGVALVLPLFDPDASQAPFAMVGAFSFLIGVLQLSLRRDVVRLVGAARLLRGLGWDGETFPPEGPRRPSAPKE